MIKVYQTRFGGFDASDAEKGNCWQAAVASILEIPLEEAFDLCPIWDDDDWFDKFNVWLNGYGFASIGYTVDDGVVDGMQPLGYHLIESKSTTLKNGELHITVGYNGKVVHDPNPNAKGVGKQMLWFLFIALDPAISRSRDG